MQRRTIFVWLVRISRFGLAALFLFAVVAKLIFIKDPVNSFLTNLPALVGDRWTVPVAIAVIGGETLTVIFLLLPRTTRIGGALAALMLIVFAGYALYFRYWLGNAEGLECGCFGGIIASQLGFSTALRNLLLLIPAGLVVFGTKQRPKETAPPTPQPPEFDAQPVA
jgi:hypothetical protein